MKRFLKSKASLWVPKTRVWFPLTEVKSSVSSRIFWSSEFAPEKRSVPTCMAPLRSPVPPISTVGKMTGVVRASLIV